MQGSPSRANPEQALEIGFEREAHGHDGLHASDGKAGRRKRRGGGGVAGGGGAPTAQKEEEDVGGRGGG